MDLILDVISNLFTLKMILILLGSVIGGIIIGALPGLSATMAVALLVPVTFGMDPVLGLSMLVAIYASSIYGGSLAAILIHTPGTPSSAATAIDGYQMTLKGEAGKAIGIATIGSVIGGFISGLALLFLAPPLSQVALLFSAPEYFLVAVFGLTIISSIATSSMVKGLISGLIGLIAGTVGMDIITGENRFTFGVLELEGGIELVPAMIGLFSISQVMLLMESSDQKDVEAETDSSKVTFKEMFAMRWLILRSSVIGGFVGLLPGAGGDIGSWVSYNEAKRFSKNKEKFGHGAEEGVAAAETANNGVTGASLIPLLTLGIPGSSVGAVLLGGIIIHGLVPGRELFTTYGHITYTMIIAFLIANILMGIVGLAGIRFFVYLFSVSKDILIPIIIIFSVVGSFAMNGSLFDVWVMLAFGVLGYFFRKGGFHPAPVVLGLILGPIAEINFRQSLVMSHGDVLSYYLSRPTSVVLIVLVLLALLAPLFMNRLKRKNVPN